MMILSLISFMVSNLCNFDVILLGLVIQSPLLPFLKVENFDRDSEDAKEKENKADKHCY